MSIEAFTALYVAGLVILGLAAGEWAVDVLVAATRDEETEALLQQD